MSAAVARWPQSINEIAFLYYNYSNGEKKPTPAAATEFEKEEAEEMLYGHHRH